MVKIFIGSSLQLLFRNLRNELREALEIQGFLTIMWENSRPAGLTVSDGELQMIKESDICVFLLGSKLSQGTLDEYNFSKKCKKGIILIDMSAAEDKTNEEMNHTLKKEIWEIERKEKRITINWTSSRRVALQIKNGIITKFPELVQTSEARLMDLNNIQYSIIKELKGFKIRGVGRIIEVASPFDYRDGFFDFSKSESFFKYLKEKGSGCLPSHHGNPEYGPKQMVYVDINKRGRIGVYSDGSIFTLLTVCSDRYLKNHENYLPSVDIFNYIYSIIFFLKSMFEKVEYDGLIILTILIDQCEGKQLAIDEYEDFLFGTPPPCKVPNINVKMNLDLQNLKTQEQLIDVTRNIIQELLGYFHLPPNIVSKIEALVKKSRVVSFK